MGARGHKERTAFQSIKSHVGVLGPEREVRNGGEIVVSAELAAKEEAAAALLGSHNCNKKKKYVFFLWPPSACRRSKQRDVWDRLSSGKTLTEPEA